VATLRSTSLARFVELKLDGVDVVFSDNYFDLPAGCPVDIRFPVPEGWDAARLQSSLRCTSLFDSF
jgi:beta-mannosidase